jgi:uncharacterized protein YhbP (UPF0306 family)
MNKRQKRDWDAMEDMRARHIMVSGKRPNMRDALSVPTAAPAITTAGRITTPHVIDRLEYSRDEAECRLIRLYQVDPLSQHEVHEMDIEEYELTEIVLRLEAQIAMLREHEVKLI